MAEGIENLQAKYPWMAATDIVLIGAAIKKGDVKQIQKVVTKYDAKLLNRANHVFGKKNLAKHELGGFLDEFSGDQVKAFQSLDKATQKLVSQGKINGNFRNIVRVKGVEVTVKGKVINGVANISSAFIPK